MHPENGNLINQDDLNIESNVDVKRARQIVLNDQKENMLEIIEMIRVNNLQGLENLNNYITYNNWPAELERAKYRFSIVKEITKCAEVLQNKIEGNAASLYSYQHNLNNGF